MGIKENAQVGKASKQSMAKSQIMLHKVLLCVLIGIAKSQSGAISYSYDRIVGGNEVEIEDHPWQANLIKYGDHVCGGIIIAPQCILTASHCVIGHEPEAFSVQVGSKDQTMGGQLLHVAEVHHHLNFTWLSLDFDIGLVRLAEKIVYGPTARPLRISLPNEEVTAGTVGVVSGWGSTQDSNESTQFLRAVQVPVASMMSCKAAYGETAITSRMICAGASGKGVCIGDSGGPLVVHESLVGITSWGKGCVEEGFPAVFTRVNNPDIYDWIWRICSFSNK